MDPDYAPLFLKVIVVCPPHSKSNTIVVNHERSSPGGEGHGVEDMNFFLLTLGSGGTYVMFSRMVQFCFFH